MNVPSGWYAILDSAEVPHKKPLGVVRFGVPLVVWRDGFGKIVVMNDLCPHRSAKLSLGKVSDSVITCPYHGFQFAVDGTCQHVPETNKAAPNLQVKKYTVREDHGFIWVLWGADEEPTNDIPWFDNLDSKFYFSQLKKTWATHISRCIENQIDYAHLPYVHRQSIGKGLKAHTKRELLLDPAYIRIQIDAAKSHDSFLEFRFQNIWQLRISPKFSIVMAFAPVHDGETELYLRSYQKLSTIPLVKDILGWLINRINTVILNQDKSVVLSQHPNSSVDYLEQDKEMLFPSDRAIEYFRQRWRLGAEERAKHFGNSC